MHLTPTETALIIFAIKSHLKRAKTNRAEYVQLMHKLNGTQGTQEANTANITWRMVRDSQGRYIMRSDGRIYSIKRFVRGSKELIETVPRLLVPQYIKSDGSELYALRLGGVVVKKYFTELWRNGIIDFDK